MGPKEYPEATPPPSGKISDSLATYTATPSTKSWKPAAATPRIAGLEASNEVWEFAREHQLIPHLETSIRLARETLHDTRRLELSFQPDPEIPGLHGIGIHAKMGTTDLEVWERQYRAFEKKFDREAPKYLQIKISLFLEGH
jgi:hypothetical protein